MPGDVNVPMWGFAPDVNNSFTADTNATVPGPVITVPFGDPNLIINLKNNLTEPVSLVIPGLTAVMDPNFFTDDQGRRRVRSFTHETAPGAVGMYEWGTLRAGSLLYQSGTHPAVQVQMGLYGAVNIAGDPNDPNDLYGDVNDLVLFFSEIDPALHQAVADGNFGPAKPVTSTIEYHPKYFLISGQPYVLGASPLTAADP